MDSKRLRGLLAIAEHGNFGRAATAMGLSQPSLSRQIALLEAEISMPLLYRNGRGASLTPEGQRLVDAASPLIWALDALPSAINDSEPQGQVVLGMPTFLSAHVAEPIFGALKARYPRLHVKLVDGFSGFVSQWLQEGRLDIAVLYAARQSPTISAEPLADEELFLFAARALGEEAVDQGIIPAQGSAPIEAISQLDIILPGREHGLRRALQRAGARPDAERLLEVESLAAIRALVRHGSGWSILPRAGLTAGDNVDLMMWPLGDPPMRVRLMLAFGANRPFTPALRAVTNFLKEEVARLQDRQVMSPPIPR